MTATSAYVILWRPLGPGGTGSDDGWRLQVDEQGAPVIYAAHSAESAAGLLTADLGDRLVDGDLARGVEVWPVPTRNARTFPVQLEVPQPQVKVGATRVLTGVVR